MFGTLGGASGGVVHLWTDLACEGLTQGRRARHPQDDKGQLTDDVQPPGQSYRAGMELQLAMGRVRRMPPAARDALFAAAIALLTEQDLWFNADLGNPVGPRPAVAVFYLATSLSLAWRRRAPLAVLAFVSTAGAAQYVVFGAPESLGIFVPPLIALYSVGRYSETISVLLAVPIALLGTVVHDLKDPQFQLSGVTFFFWALLALAWPLGRAFRARDIDVLRLASHAHELERERDAALRSAIIAERGRISRELHDVVGHAISVAVLQLQAAQALLDRGDTDGAAVRLVSTERSARQALSEMRRLVGLTDEDDDPALTPQPGLAQLDRLLAETRAAGAQIEVELTGDRTELPPGLDLAAFRIVQEGLTNVLRHARPAVACLRIRHHAAGLTLEITSNGASAPTDPAGPGPGRGITGMRERVALYGGDLEVGPQASGDFLVRAHFPLEGEQP